MFLDLLNKKEQENFLELAYEAMNADGIITESELQIFEVFKREVAMTDYVLKNLPIEKLKMSFDMSTKKVKKAVLMELAGVLYADKKVAEVEEKWLLALGKEWGFRESEIKKIIRWVQDFNDLLAEGIEYINRKERL